MALLINSKIVSVGDFNLNIDKWTQICYADLIYRIVSSERPLYQKGYLYRYFAMVFIPTRGISKLCGKVCSVLPIQLPRTAR